MSGNFYKIRLVQILLVADTVLTMSTRHQTPYLYWNDSIKLSVELLNPDFVFVHCRISIPANLDAQPKLKMPTSEITVCSSLSGWFKDVARAVSRIYLQTSGWLLRYAINTAGNLREMPVPFGVQFGRELSILFGEPISLTPFFVGRVTQPVRLTIIEWRSSKKARTGTATAAIATIKSSHHRRAASTFTMSENR